MKEDTTKPLSKVIRIDESEIRGQLDEMIRGHRVVPPKRLVQHELS